MRFKQLTDIGSDKLLIIFAGWGMDEKPFLKLRRNDCDIAVVYDYGNDSVIKISRKYTDIKVMAWSFGVIAADAFLADNPELPVTLSVAVNGTLYPADDERGIPTDIFLGTLENLSERSLTKFYRRMCGNAESFKVFMDHKPERDIESLRSELETIAGCRPSHQQWDSAIVSLDDRIIPATNQIKAWNEEGVRIIRIKGPHMPDFQSLIATIITNKQLVAKRFGEAKTTYDGNAEIQRETAAKLSAAWEKAGTHFPEKVIEIGAGTGMFTDMYMQWLRPRNLELWDLSEIPPRLPGQHLICDAEEAIRQCETEKANAIVAASTIQWFDSPERFFKEAARVLCKDGILAISTFGPDNFREIRPSLYPSRAEIVALLEKAGFSIEYSEETLTTMEFGSTKLMLEHFRSTGVNATAYADPAKTAIRLIRHGVKSVTYHPIIIVARKKVNP